VLIANISAGKAFRGSFLYSKLRFRMLDVRAKQAQVAKRGWPDAQHRRHLEPSSWAGQRMFLSASTSPPPYRFGLAATCSCSTLLTFRLLSIIYTVARKENALLHGDTGAERGSRVCLC
jgi:hypothetical protein